MFWLHLSRFYVVHIIWHNICIFKYYNFNTYNILVICFENQLDIIKLTPNF
jgi:hypothetical protein